MKRSITNVASLFDAMKCDMGVMSEHDDNETSLLMELLTCDDDIITEYKDAFLK